MAIQSVSQAEFEEAVPDYSEHMSGAKLSEESKASITLDIGQAIKFPCRWGHRSRSRRCSGTAIVQQAAKRHDQRLVARCRDGTVWVLRIE